MIVCKLHGKWQAKYMLFDSYVSHLSGLAVVRRDLSGVPLSLLSLFVPSSIALIILVTASVVAAIARSVCAGDPSCLYRWCSICKKK